MKMEKQKGVKFKWIGKKGPKAGWRIHLQKKIQHMNTS